MEALRTERVVENVVMAVYNPNDDAYRWLSVDAVPQFRPGERAPYQVYSLFDDITERRRAQERLLESERDFRGTFENAAVGIGHVSMNGEWLRVNETLCAITGYSKEELLQKTFQDITHPDDLNSDLAQFEQLIAGEINSYAMEKRYFRGDGSIVWINLTAALRRGEDGKPRYGISVIEDISVRKEAEAALRRSEERIQLAIEATNLGIWEYDLLTQETVFSPLAEEILSLEVGAPHAQEEPLSRVHPDDQARVLRAVQGALDPDGSGHYSLEYRVVWPDKTVRWVTGNARATFGVVDGLKQALQLVGTLTDITERKAAEAQLLDLNQALEGRVQARTAELRKSEEIILTLYEIASQRETATTQTKDFAEKVRSLLRIGAKRFALPIGLLAQVEEERYGVLYAVSPDDVIAEGSHFDLAKTYCERTIQAGGPVGFEHAGASQWQRHPAYAEFGLEAYLGTPVFVNGERYGTLNFSSPEPRKAQPFSDIDKRVLELMASWVGRELERFEREGRLREARDELAQRSAALEAANKELEAFSYSVSHDLRAPLRGIDGFSQALLEDFQVGDTLDESAVHYLQRVRTGAQRMGVLIDDMLAFSRLSRSDMQREEVNLSAKAESIVTDLREREPERTVSVEIQSGLIARGDKRLLRIALANLFENAWKFTRHEEAAHITFGVDEEGAFFVRDNGAGFDMAYANKLFGAFQRLHSPGQFEGTGIGLATVQRVVHRHGGAVWAEAKVG